MPDTSSLTGPGSTSHKGAAAASPPAGDGPRGRTGLTPSDLVFLKAMPRWNRELNGDPQVEVESPPKETIEKALAAAILANEEAGVLRLDVVEEKVQRQKVFFGLFTSTTTTPSYLQAVRVGKGSRWPSESLENGLTSSGKVSDSLFGWIGADSTDPRTAMTRRTMDRMARRRLLDEEVVRKRVLRLFTMTSDHYVLPERTSALIGEASARPLDARMEAPSKVRRRLMEEIGSAFSRRTEVAG